MPPIFAAVSGSKPHPDIINSKGIGARNRAEQIGIIPSYSQGFNERSSRLSRHLGELVRAKAILKKMYLKIFYNTLVARKNYYKSPFE